MGSSYRIFVSFAIEDEHYRDFLRGQAKNGRSPFEFVDMSVKELGARIGRRGAEPESRAAMAQSRC